MFTYTGTDVLIEVLPVLLLIIDGPGTFFILKYYPIN